MTDPTKSSITPTKTQTMLQSLYFLPNTYFLRTESIIYVYQPNISPVLAITYYILYFHKIWINEITNPTKTSSTPTKSQTVLQSLHVFLEHTPKGWNQIFMFTCPILVQFWPLHAHNSIVVDQNESFY
jgi:hypothetical protein